MIDEKKITEAMSSYATETWNHAEERFVAMNGFKEGVEWAQKEFIKSLWHDAAEEPEEGKKCIGRYKCLPNIIRSFELPIAHTTTWDMYIHYSTLDKWCYADDIIPKKGGKG